MDERNLHAQDADRRILVVDDDEFLRNLLFRYLTHKEYVVSTAKNGQDGIEQAKKGRFFMALVDIILPDLNGIEVVDRIRKIQPELLIIIMTGHPTLQTSIEAINRGVRDYLIKPFKLDQIDGILYKCLQENRILKENRVLRTELSDAKVRMDKYKSLIRQSITQPESQERTILLKKGSVSYRLQSMQGRNAVVQERLQKLETLRGELIITENEYQEKRTQILANTGEVDDHSE